MLVVLQAIETGLFSIYPFVFVVQVTWIISVMTTVMASPYVFVVLGYVGFFIITFSTFFLFSKVSKTFIVLLAFLLTGSPGLR